MEVASTLAEKVLTSPSQDVQLLAVNECVTEGCRYFDFEFTAKLRGATRHALASVTMGNGKFYTLLTGSNEKRWGGMKDKLKTVVDPFTVEDWY